MGDKNLNPHLRKAFESAILSEMLVKGKDGRDFKSFHDGKGGAVSEAETFVMDIIRFSSCLIVIHVCGKSGLCYL